jgi:hypothetical protein
VLDGQSVGSFPLYRGTRPNANFNQIFIMDPAVTTKYNALVLEARKRFAQGLLFDANYTLAKSTDNGQTSATFFPFSGSAFDPLTYRSNPVDSAFTPSAADRRHRFVASFFYQPSYLWGFGVGGVLTLQSALPITEGIQGSLAGAVGAVNSSTTNGTGGSTVAPWVGFTTDRQTGLKTLDLRVMKDIRVSGSRRFQLIYEVFNVFNTENDNNFFSSAFDVTSSSYNAVTNTATVNLTHDTGFLVPRAASTVFGGMRDMQLGLKFLF